MACLLRISLLAGVAWNFSAASQAIRWDPSLRHYTDAQGRARIFHGTNVVYKKEPWLPPTDRFDTQSSLAAKDIDLLQKWGFNAVRLGVMWPGVEPEHEKISQSYLDSAAKVIDTLGKQGIYTVVDLHQDIGSRRFCGEGFPEYYVDELLKDPNSSLSKAKPFPAPRKALAVNSSTGLPLLSDCLKAPFQDYYATYQAGALWRSLYETGSSLNSGFLRYWSAVAKRFSSVESVLGYELLNEPSGWCIEGKCSSLPALDNSIEEKYLMPLYRAAAAEIRNQDPNHIIYYEPTVYPKARSLLGRIVFPEPVLGNDTQQGLAYHVYCEAEDDSSIGASMECKLVEDLFTHEFWNELDRFPVAGFMTEFGAVSDRQGQLDHITRLLEYADDRFQSWTYWMMKLFNDFTTTEHLESFYGADGKLELAKMRTLSRTYAQAIAGIPKRMKFDVNSAAFELDYNATIADSPTEIYLNEELHYPNGYSVSVTPSDCVTTEKKTNLVLLHLQGGSCHRGIVSVRLAAKPSNHLELVV